MHKQLYMLVILIVLLTGCKSESPQEDKIDLVIETTPVSFHHYFSGNLDGGINEMVDVYNGNQSDYHLKAVPIDHEAYKVSILETFKNGEPSDLYSYWAGARTQSILEYLTPLDDVYNNPAMADAFNQTLLASAAIYDEHYYFLPILQHYVTFFYSKEVFAEYNLMPPETWDEFHKVCAVLKANDVTPIGLGAKNKWPAQFWFDYILLRTAGNAYRSNLMDNSASYTDPEVKRTMILWKELIDLGYFNEDTAESDWDLAIADDMMNGDIGMTLMGTWMIAILDNNDYKDGYGVFSFPIIDDSIPLTALGPVDGIVIAHDALNPNGAKDAIKAFATIDAQIKMSQGSGGFAPNAKVPLSIYDDNQQQLLGDINESASWAFNYDLATKPEIAEEGLNMFIEFLTFPEAYEYLLEDISDTINP